MKKLVVLALVLAISGVASAALTFNLVATDRNPNTTGLQVNPSDIVEIQVIADTQNADVGLLIAINGNATASMANAYQTVVPANGLTDYSGATPDKYLYFADVAIVTVPPTPMANGLIIGGITFHCDGPGDVTIALSELTTGEVFSAVTVQQLGVPEPMTLGLLGLGGLFLRRRLA